MTQSNGTHIDIVVNKSRIELLLAGRDIHITQNETKIRLIPQLDCCVEFKKLRKSYGGKKLSKTFSRCPYCGETIVHSQRVKKYSKKKVEEV